MALFSQAATSDRLIFQDVVKDQKGDDELSLAFFELANVPVVGYRFQNRRTGSPLKVSVRQDVNAATHTGGIVWETSYLLLNYLLAQKTKLGRVLEVGAGCGLLGQVLGASGWCKQVVMTECQLVYPNLESNLLRNAKLFQRKKSKGAPPVVAQKLDWLTYRQDATAGALEKRKFDTIVGTDVIFTPSLVEPLLKTLKFMSHANTTIYLCLQVRCRDSHELLFEMAPRGGIRIEEMNFANTPGCAWGSSMECCLLKLTFDATIIKKKRGVNPANNGTAETPPAKRVRLAEDSPATVSFAGQDASQGLW